MKFIQFQPFTTISFGLWLLCLLESCALFTNQPEQNPQSTLLVIGDQVQVNKRPAVNGQILKPNDENTTGPNSSAYIQCYKCYLIQIDETTDYKTVKQIKNWGRT
jgi:hypothetical protein